MNSKLERLKALDREVQVLSHITAILGWDQETYMPPNAVEERSDQLSAVQALLHEKRTSHEIGELLAALGSTADNPKGDPSLEDTDRAFLRVIHRDYSRETRLPTGLVVRLAKLTSMGQARWAEARKRSDFAAFAPVLSEIVDLTIEVADRLGYDEDRYDALLDAYEPWMRTAKVKEVFDGLQKELVPLVDAIKGSPQVADRFLMTDFPVSLQDRFGRFVLERMEWDFGSGRLDLSTHPFTSTLGANDVRLTTRYDPHNFKSGLFSTIHEAGHGLYELGFADELKGTSLGNAVSLGVHESQSRTWENIVGRSLPFWKYFYPKLQDSFSSQLSDHDIESFYRAVNKVEPTHIRVDADEVTYSLHVILRFNLELRLVSQELSVKDLPEAWREESRRLLGIVPQTDALGVLQDIHWSMGSIGYFPTYALGNLYGAQFTAKMRKDIPDLDGRLEKGELSAVLDWLRANIHRRGCSATAEELVSEVTGEELTSEYFVRYLKEKYREIYNLKGI
ncbi:carboxypeptidase M32 [Salinispira pacifica]